MGNSKLRGKDLRKIGYPQSKAISIALGVMDKYFKHEQRDEKLAILQKVLDRPEDFLKEEYLSKVAEELVDKQLLIPTYELNPEPLPYEVFGTEQIEAGAKAQMKTAMQLPIALDGALMPDAHQGYGLPIGGVFATENNIIPYGVGVDIGCRMCLTFYDMSKNYVERYRTNLKKQLVENTCFGTGKGFAKPMDDAVLERNEFKEIPMVRSLKDTAFAQIGSSGTGNHFVECGEVEILDPQNEFGLPIGTYFGILSHSGSRGLGARIAGHYTKLAMENCVLPKFAQHLAWLDLNSEVGQEYWLAMNLAGDYASACHHQIHKRMSKAIGEKPLAMVENHHNFAWKEKWKDGREVIVHRKGATPAGKGVLGIIPGSMTAPGFIVRGKGEVNSLNSASHGAGRVMSRRKAIANLNKKEVKDFLAKHGVDLIGGGIDEAPMVYKDINEVMNAQQDLVDVIGRFQPKIVRMADE